MTDLVGLNRKSGDEFYTDPRLALALISKVSASYPLSSFDRIVEPSAGSGAFSDYFKKNRYPLDAYDSVRGRNIS